MRLHFLESWVSIFVVGDCVFSKAVSAIRASRSHTQHYILCLFLVHASTQCMVHIIQQYVGMSFTTCCRRAALHPILLQMTIVLQGLGWQPGSCMRASPTHCPLQPQVDGRSPIRSNNFSSPGKSTCGPLASDASDGILRFPPYRFVAALLCTLSSLAMIALYPCRLQLF